MFIHSSQHICILYINIHLMYINLVWYLVFVFFYYALHLFPIWIPHVCMYLTTKLDSKPDSNYSKWSGLTLSHAVPDGSLIFLGGVAPEHGQVPLACFSKPVQQPGLLIPNVACFSQYLGWTFVLGHEQWFDFWLIHCNRCLAFVDHHETRTIRVLFKARNH